MRCIALLLIVASIAQAEPPVDVGDQAQLFIDQTIVSSSAGVSFTVHPGTKHPANPLRKADKPWEGWRISIYGSVIYDRDEKLFKMWYLGDTSPAYPNFCTYYATSVDGVHWEKPLVNVARSATGEPTNGVLAETHLASVTKDDAEPDPAKRYKMVAYVHLTKPVGGPHTFVSPDGLHWTKTSDKPICRSNDVITAWRDRRTNQWVALPKLSTMVRGQIRRCFGQSVSSDFVKWTEPRYVFTPDRRDDAGSLARIEAVRPLLDREDDFTLMRTEFYGVGVYQHGSCVVGFPWVFTINNNGRYGNHEGPAEIQLAVTRDLETWERPLRTPIVPQGKVGEWDSGFLVSSAEALRVGDEVWLYYSGANYTHGSPCLYRDDGTRGSEHTASIGLVTWKLDRFVSAEAGSDGGVITTAPLRVGGERLELNAAVKQGGSIVVEWCDASGKVVATSEPVTGDSLRHAVRFPGAVDASKPVVLKLRMRSAELYSVRFGG
jgi:hypothetical protein